MYLYIYVHTHIYTHDTLLLNDQGSEISTILMCKSVPHFDFEIILQSFQRKIHENLAQLEMINKQYRRMARESRTDTNLQLRKMVHEANNRWDDVARRCNKVLRRMKALLTQKEEFDSTRESMIVWLTEMDLQLTNVEHFSESEVSIKVKQMKVSILEFETGISFEYFTPSHTTTSASLPPQPELPPPQDFLQVSCPTFEFV